MRNKLILIALLLLVSAASGEEAYEPNDEPIDAPWAVYWRMDADGLLCAQPTWSEYMAEGLDLPLREWYMLIAANWLASVERGCFDGDLWRDGVINLRDVAVLAKFWSNT
jgi:hypothetical protein